MDQSLKSDNRNYYLFSLSVSIALHVIILLIIFIVLKKGEESYRGKGIDVQLMQGENFIPYADEMIHEKVNSDESKKISKNSTDVENSNNEADLTTKSVPEKTLDMMKQSVSGYYNFEGVGNDTSGLIQVYAEKTLNVKIKYPIGWTYVDQDRQNKLDGVTFWANNGIFNPPPYIFLEVKEKYLFNPSRFKFNTKLDNSIAYYNDPEELEGQVSQVFYIRTETDEDYSIKLIMTGKDTFTAFQPIFFGMIKSFNFGKSIF